MNYTGTLVVVECAACNMDFGMTSRFKQERQRDHRTFYCPAGHSNYYDGESDIEKALRQRDEANSRVEMSARELEIERQATIDARNRARAEKAAKTRLKNRIAKGVCPCCNRYFRSVHDHIAKEHPDYVIPS